MALIEEEARREVPEVFGIVFIRAHQLSRALRGTERAGPITHCKAQGPREGCAATSPCVFAIVRQDELVIAFTSAPKVLP